MSQSKSNTGEEIQNITRENLRFFVKTCVFFDVATVDFSRKYARNRTSKKNRHYIITT